MKIGDSVKIIEDEAASTTNIGKTGVIVGVHSNGRSFCVEPDEGEFWGAWECQGITPNGTGRFFKPEYLQLIQEEIIQEEIIKDKEYIKMHSRFITTENHDLLKACIDKNQPSLLIGETGTGKTTLIRELAKEKKSILHRVSVNGSMGVEEILGKWLVKDGTTYWQDGILPRAMKKGEWVVFDEINAALPEILFALHSLLDDDRKITLAEKDGEIVTPHANFRFFATMNPPEEYAGTKDMNKALMSRFTAVLVIEVLDQKSEYELLTKEKGADDKTAEILVRIATALRDEKKKENISYFCSTRDLVQCAFLVSTGLELQTALTGSIINKMTSAEYDVVKNHFSGIIKKVESRGKTFAEIEKEWSESQEVVKGLNTKIAELQSAKDGIKSETIRKILQSVEEVSA